MDKLLISDLSVQAGNFQLSNINFSLQENDYLVVMGPTGCGKTLLLETIAGLASPKAGSIFLNGEDITNKKIEHRQFGFAYQDSLLYPFLTVRENILFSARGEKKEPKIIERMYKLTEMMNIHSLLDRYPARLSGGEKQRVSLARALLMKPQLLLLDEPVSALDPKTKLDMYDLLKKIYTEEQVTIIHVTHDFTEALALATKVMLLNKGEIDTFLGKDQFFHGEKTPFASEFVCLEQLKKIFEIC